MPKEIAAAKLKDGRIASLSFLDKDDNTKEILRFINSIIDEKPFLLFDKRFTLKEEEEWKKKELDKIKKNEGYQILARIDGKVAGSSGAGREIGKGRGNVLLGISIAKQYRGIGLGEFLLRTNIELAKKKLHPKIIYLSVLRANKPAHSLYLKLGFKEFAVFPKWINHYGKYMDQIFMKL